MNIPIIFEDDNYIIFNKPAGLMVHADGRNTEPTLVDWLLENCPEISEVGEPIILKSGEKIPKPGIVHRLDKDTSGVLVVAKNQKSFEDLKLKFQNREVEKTYHAFVYGNLKEEDGTIDRPIGRSKSDFRMWSAQRGARGEMREAVTDFKVINRYDGATLVEVRPKTGRTHQIRVHFKAIHHPVVADPLYAPKKEPLFGFERQALHALKIAFTSIDGKRVSAEAPYPADFERAVKSL